MNSTSLDSRFQALKTTGGFDQAVVDRLARYLAEEPEERLFRMSPLRYGKEVGLSEHEAIDLFLYATHAGILDFSWGILCPLCMSFMVTAGALRTLHEDRFCPLCRIDVKGEVDDNVEVAFTVSSAVRRIRFQDPASLDMRQDAFRLFFSPSVPPDCDAFISMKDAHVDAYRIPAGGVEELRLNLPADRYIVMVPASHTVLHFEAAAGVSNRTLTLELLDGCCVPDTIRAATGEILLKVRNQTKRPEDFLISSDPSPPLEGRPDPLPRPDHHMLPFLTGKRLITTQAFRDLFRAESIPSEGGLELKTLTVLFTDLKGSTEMYERIGDLRAYDLVRQHFSTLKEISVAQGGAIVKTIGDAIMATFPEPEPGLQAAVEMNREIRKVGGGEDLRLKIGMHCGPCIAVELNERLDYFGRTVNIAARVQGVAEASEIVITDPVFRSPGSARIIEESSLKVERGRVSLKGIAGDTPVYRLR